MNFKNSAFKSLVIVAAVAFGAVSCKKDEDKKSASATLEFNNINVEVPISLVAGDFADSVNVTNTIDSVLKARSISKSDVSSIKVSSISLIDANTADLNSFSLISSISASISKDSTNSYINVANILENPDSASADTIMMVPNTAVNAKAALTGTNFFFKVNGTTRNITLTPMGIRVNAKFTIKAAK